MAIGLTIAENEHQMWNLIVHCICLTHIYWLLSLFSGILYVIVEYCRFGNLRSYLLNRRPTFVDTMDNSNAVITKLQKENAISRNTSGGRRDYVNTR